MELPYSQILAFMRGSSRVKWKWEWLVIKFIRNTNFCPFRFRLMDALVDRLNYLCFALTC